MHKLTIDLTGKRYGRLTVVEYLGARVEKAGSRIWWRARCDCGNETEVRAGNLKSGNTISCGCAGSRHTIGDRNRTHGKRSHPLFPVWNMMKQRCSNPNVRGFENYGGRGIRVCKRWMKFQAFFDDMAPTWKQGLTIERKNNNGNYSPRNCRWATRYEQLQNYRKNHLIKTPWGRIPITKAADLAGLNRTTVMMRARRYGYPESRLLEPVKQSRKT